MFGNESLPDRVLASGSVGMVIQPEGEPFSVVKILPFLSPESTEREEVGLMLMLLRSRPHCAFVVKVSPLGSPGDFLSGHQSHDFFAAYRMKKCCSAVAHREAEALCASELRFEEAVTLLGDLASALVFLYSIPRGKVFFPDLKPANVCYDPDRGVYVLVDIDGCLREGSPCPVQYSSLYTSLPMQAFFESWNRRLREKGLPTTPMWAQMDSMMQRHIPYALALIFFEALLPDEVVSTLQRAEGAQAQVDYVQALCDSVGEVIKQEAPTLEPLYTNMRQALDPVKSSGDFIASLEGIQREARAWLVRDGHQLYFPNLC